MTTHLNLILRVAPKQSETLPAEFVSTMAALFQVPTPPPTMLSLLSSLAPLTNTKSRSSTTGYGQEHSPYGSVSIPWEG